jgi:hypothetical protein
METPGSGGGFLRRIGQFLKRSGLVIFALRELIKLLIKLLGGDDM